MLVTLVVIALVVGFCGGIVVGVMIWKDTYADPGSMPIRDIGKSYSKRQGYNDLPRTERPNATIPGQSARCSCDPTANGRRTGFPCCKVAAEGTGLPTPDEYAEWDRVRNLACCKNG